MRNRTLILKSETLRTLRSGELAIVRGGQLGMSVWVRCPGTQDPSVLNINCGGEGSGNSCVSVERCGTGQD